MMGFYGCLLRYTQNGLKLSSHLRSKLFETYYSPQHFLYFFPFPHRQEAFLFGFSCTNSFVFLPACKASISTDFISL